MLALIAAIVAGFVTTLLLTREAIAFLKNSGIVGIDQQKADKQSLATSGGVPVMFGFLAAVSVFLGVTTFLPGQPVVATELVLAALASVFVIGVIGLIDDIHVDRNGREEKGATQVRVGLAQKYKYAAPLIAALPLMVVKAGTATMMVPFVGSVAFGVLYPLVLIPVAVTCVVNATNMLAGQNGLEASMGAVALMGIGTFAYLQGSLAGTAIAFSMAAALAAFLIFNFYPARILPGDSLTYAIGAAIVSAVVVANVERFALIVFLPWIAEAFLKLRSRFQASSVGELQPDGTLRPRHDAVYSLTHVLMRFKRTEPQIVVMAAAAELLLVLAAFAVSL